MTNEKGEEIDEEKFEMPEIPEELDNYIKKIVEEKLTKFEKRIKSKPSGISLNTWLDIYRFIEKNIMVTKEDLINQFPTLATPTNFINVRNVLTSLGEIDYLSFKGKHYKARFVYIGNDKSPQAYAVKFFRQTNWGEPIIINSTDPELRAEITSWIKKIFGDITIETVYSQWLMKGTVRDRKKLLKKLST